METILSSYIFSYFSLGFCIFSRETGGLNRIIDRGSRAINFILSAMVFNVVPTILEVWGWIFNWLLSYLTFMMPLDFVPWMLLFNFSDTYIMPYFGVFLGISYYTIILASSFFSWNNSTDLTCFLPDIYGIRYSVIQIWSNFCMDYFTIGCCIYHFYIISDTGIISQSRSLSGMYAYGLEKWKNRLHLLSFCMVLS